MDSSITSREKVTGLFSFFNLLGGGY